MPQRASISQQGDNILLRIEYNRRAISVLKQLIPAEGRTYESTTQTWTIDAQYKESVQYVLTQFYPVVNQGDVRVRRV